MNFPFQRIALFCDSLNPSDVGRVMDTLARHLHRRGFSVFLICDEGEGADDLWHRARPFVCDGLRLRLRTPNDHQARAQLQAKLREWGIEVFHAHNGIAWEGHAGLTAAREAGVPLVVATEHLPAWKEWGDFLPWKRDALREVDALFAVSLGVRDSFVSLDLVPPLEPNAQAGRVEAVDNGVEEDEEQDKEEARRAVRCELGLPQGTPLLLFCGRLVEQKDSYALFRFDCASSLKRNAKASSSCSSSCCRRRATVGALSGACSGERSGSARPLLGQAGRCSPLDGRERLLRVALEVRGVAARGSRSDGGAAARCRLRRDRHT